MTEDQVVSRRQNWTIHQTESRLRNAERDFRRDASTSMTIQFGVISFLLATILLVFAHGCHGDEDNELSILRFQESRREPKEKPRP